MSTSATCRPPGGSETAWCGCPTPARAPTSRTRSGGRHPCSRAPGCASTPATSTSCTSTSASTPCPLSSCGSSWLRCAADGKPLVLTVHDLRNPHHARARAARRAARRARPGRRRAHHAHARRGRRRSSGGGAGRRHVLPHPHVVGRAGTVAAAPAARRLRRRACTRRACAPTWTPCRSSRPSPRSCPTLPGRPAARGRPHRRDDPGLRQPRRRPSPPACAGSRRRAGSSCRSTTTSPTTSCGTTSRASTSRCCPTASARTPAGWRPATTSGRWVVAPDCGFYAEQRPVPDVCRRPATTSARPASQRAVRAAYSQLRPTLAGRPARDATAGQRDAARRGAPRRSTPTCSTRSARMHVVIIAAARHPLREPFAGGLESLTWDLVRGLRRRGVDVTLFAGPGSDPDLGAREVVVQPAGAQRGRPRRRLDAAGARGCASTTPTCRSCWSCRPAETSTSSTTTASTTCRSRWPPACARADGHDPAHPADPVARAGDRPDGPGPGAVRRGQRATPRGQWAHVAAAEVVHNGVDTASGGVPGPAARTSCGSGGWSRRRRRTRRSRIAAASGRRIRLAGPVGDAAYFADAVAPAARPARRVRRSPRTGRPCGSWSAPAPPWSSRRRGTSRTAWSPPSRWPAAHRCVALRPGRPAASSSAPECGVLVDAGRRAGGGRRDRLGRRHGPERVPRPRRAALLARARWSTPTSALYDAVAPLGRAA